MKLKKPVPPKMFKLKICIPPVMFKLEKPIPPVMFKLKKNILTHTTCHVQTLKIDTAYPEKNKIETLWHVTSCKYNFRFGPQTRNPDQLYSVI